MRHFLCTACVLIAVAVAAGFCTFRTTCGGEATVAARDGDALKWMKAEFHLSDAQYATISRLHEEQSERCAQHCQAVSAARQQLAGAEKSGDANAIAAGRRAVAVATDICESSVEAHVRAVAAAMPAGQGDRYLAIVLPKISSMAHVGAPNVRLDH